LRPAGRRSGGADIRALGARRGTRRLEHEDPLDRAQRRRDRRDRDSRPRARRCGHLPAELLLCSRHQRATCEGVRVRIDREPPARWLLAVNRLDRTRTRNADRQGRRAVVIPRWFAVTGPAYLAALLAVDTQLSLRGQLALGVVTWALLLGACRTLPVALRVQALGVVVFATVGEVTGSLVWGVYHYRLHNLPLFIPPA